MKYKQLLFSTAAMVLCMGYATQAHAISVCIDPGHGGTDSGAVGCSLYEKEINLSVSLKLKALLEKAGWTVYMTRTGDTTVSLPGRSSYANNKGVTTFASIHTNSATSVATGIETFCYIGNRSKTSGAQASKIQAEMIKVWPLANRGVKEADYHVVRETNMPATLTELGFINNCSNDVVYLKSDAHRNTAAQAHCKGLTAQWNGSASSACSGSTSGGGGGTTPSTGTVMGGSYLDAIKGTWLGGCTVKIGSQSVVSSNDGTMWKITGVPYGNYTLTGSKDGYNTATRTDCSAASSAVSWCSFALTKKAEVIKDGTAFGSVRDSTNNTPVPASVSVEGGSTVSYNGTDNWSFTLKPGNYKITASANGYDNGTASCNVTSGGRSDCSIKINPKKGTISGKVYDKDAVSTAVPCNVTLGSQTVAYNGSSAFVFTVPAGTYTITAQNAVDYEPGSVSCTVGRGETKNDCNIALTKKPKEPEDPIVPPVTKGMVRGKLLNKDTGKEIVGTVSIKDGQQFNYGGIGAWQFYLEAGEYVFTGKSDGYHDGERTCKVTAAENNNDCDIALSPKPAEIQISVESKDNKNIASTLTIDGKTYEYDGSTPISVQVPAAEGGINVTAQPKDNAYQSNTATCQTAAGQLKTCVIYVYPEGVQLGALTGTVSHEGAAILHISADVSIEGFKTVHYGGGENEKWYIENLPVGSYSVTAKKEGYYDASVSCMVYPAEGDDMKASATECSIIMKEIHDNGASGHLEVGVLPKVTVSYKDDCSARPYAPSSPVGLIAAAAGLLGLCIVRRRRSGKGE